MATIRELRARFTASAQGFRQSIQAINQDMESVGQSGEQASEKANNGFAKLKQTLVGFAGAYLGFQAIQGAVGGVISVTDEYQRAMNKLQTETGANSDEMYGYSEQLKEIYAGNYGEGFQDIAESMASVKQATDLSGDALTTMTKKAILLRDSMGYDVTESTATASTMMKQFGIDGDQAFELIAQGRQEGLDKNGDWLDSLNEYSVYFKQLGFDAEGMWNVFKAGSDAGAFNMDKVGDSIKELGIRVKDGSKGTADAFAGLGMNADKMAQMFAKGGASSQKALQMTFNALGKIDDPVKRNTIGVALMGSQFEDLEYKTIQALGTVKNQANMSGDALAKIDKVQYNSIGQAFEGLKRQIIVGLLEPIQTYVMPMMNTFVNFMRDNMPQIKNAIVGAFTGIMSFIQALQPAFSNLWTILSNVGSVVIPILVGAIKGIMAVAVPLVTAITDIGAKFTSWEGFIPVVLGLATAFGTYMAITKASVMWTNLVSGATKLWALAQAGLNLVMSMNPIALIVSLIAGLVVAIIYAYNHSETFRTIVQNAWQGIKNVVSAVVSWFTTTIPQWIASLVAWFTNLGTSMASIWQSIWSKVTSIWNSIVSTVSGLVSGFVSAVSGFISRLASNIMNFISPLVSFFVNTWNNIKLMVLSILGVFLNLITGNMEGLKISLLGIWTAIKRQIINIITTLKAMGLNIWNALKNGFLVTVNALKSGAIAVFNGLKSGAVAIWNGLKSAVINSINALKSGAINSVNAIKNGVVNGFNSAKSLAINSWNALKNGVSNAINGVKTYVSNMKSNIISTIKGINLRQMGVNVIEGFINGIKSMVGAVGKAIKSVASNVTNKIKGALGIHSPSRVFMEIGQFTGEGLGIGIQKMQNFVADATQGLADASFGTINSQELNPITATVDAPGQTGQDTGTNYNAPLMNIENYYQNDQTDVRSLSSSLYNLQRNSDRKKGR